MVSVFTRWHRLRLLVATINLQIEDIQFEPDGALENETRAMVVTLKSSKREDHLKLVEKIKLIPGIVYLEAL